MSDQPLPPPPDDYEAPPQPASQSSSPPPTSKVDAANADPRFEGLTLPIDGGLGNLGLLMMWTGVCFIAMWGLFLMTSMQGGRNPFGAIMTAIILVSMIRSGMHMATGYRISTRCMGLQQNTKNYVILSVVHLVILVLLLKTSAFGKFIPESVLMGLAVMTLTWPLTLMWIANSDNIKKNWLKSEEDHAPPVPKDLGIEGYGIILIYFATLGMCLGILCLYILTGSPVGKRMSYLGFTHKIVVIGVAIAIWRSAVQLQKGLLCLNGGSYRNILKKGGLYYGLGWASTAVVIGGLFMMMNKLLERTGGSLDGIAIGFLVILGGFMIAWPFIVNLHNQWLRLQITALDLDEDQMRVSAPDGGLSSLGYLIFGSGVFLMSMFLGFMVMDAPMNEDMNKIALNGGLALWAGFELMNLSERSKIACTIYGGAGCVLGLLDFFENIDGIKMILTHAGAQELMFLVVMAAMLVASLVGPVLALFVAHRPRVSLPQ